MTPRNLSRIAVASVLMLGVVFSVTTPWPQNDLPIRVEAKFDGVNWTDISTDVHDQTARISYGGLNEMSRVQASSVTLVLDNPDGEYTPDYALSPHYPNVKLGVELRVSVFWKGVWHTRFVGRVSEWKPTWPYGDLSTAEFKGESRVTVVAAGILRQVGQGKSPLRSAPYRATLGTGPVAHWPMEDGSDATAFGSAVTGGQPLPVTANATPGASSPVSWIPALAGLTIQPGASGTMQAGIVGAEDTGEISLGFVYQRVSGDETFFAAKVDTTNGTSWRLTIDDLFNELVLNASDSGGLIGGVGGWTATLVDGNLHHVLATIDQSGADATVRIYVDGVELSLGTGNTISAVTVAAPSGMTVQWLPATPPPTQDPGELRLGHLAVWNSLPASAALGRAVNGWADEQAHERIQRLCDEQGVPVVIIGIQSELVGPQQIDTFYNLLTHASDVDLGILGEQLTASGLLYRCNATLYNQTPKLTLDAKLNHLANPFTPVLDDQGIRNDVTVERIDGSEARVVQQDGPKSVKDPPEGVGVYDEQLTLNLNTDEQARFNAGFRVWRGTYPGMRYPRVSPGINQAADVADTWLGVTLGDLVAATNLPPQHPISDVEVLARGWTETLRPRAWDVVVNGSPASPYAVGVAGDETIAGAWSQTGPATQLVSQLASGATSALVHSDGPLFTTDATELVYSPLEVVLGGEVCPVPSSPQARDTFTRSVSNGWGTSASGDVWTTSGGTAANYSVNGTQGVITTPTGDTNSRNVTQAETFSDVDVRVTVQPGQLSTGNEMRAFVLFRISNLGTGDYYRCLLQFEPTGLVDADLQSVVGGSVSTLASATAFTAYGANTDVHLHVQAHGNRLRAKAWTGDADLPPADWTVEASDATYTSGQMGLRAQQATGNTNTNPVVRFDNLWVGEAAIKSAGLDTFTRTTANGWGTSDFGHTYTLSGGSASDYSTDGARAGILVSTASALRRTVASGPSIVDGTIRGRLVPGVVATGNTFELGFSLRRVDGSNYYSAEIRFLTSGALILRFIRTLAGSAAVLAQVTLPSTYSASTELWLVFQLEGSALRAKAWDTIRSEPTGWQLEFTDTNITGSGLYGCEFRVQSGNTNVPFTGRFDDLELVNPQTVELTRTVAKTHTAGAVIQVHRPLVSSL